MGNNSIRLAKIFVIPVGVDYSWFLILILFTWTFAVGYYPTEFKNWPAIEYWMVGGVGLFILWWRWREARRVQSIAEQ